MAEPKKPATRNRKPKVPGATEQQKEAVTTATPESIPATTPLDSLPPPEPNTTGEPQTEDLSAKPNYVKEERAVMEQGKRLGNHVLTERGWIRED